ncbi:MAG: hypothetical protein HWN81_13795 [Candidatus Lokiarchaeota archaeon]|nr:hypothetical protein [Candidatus Lokiarchaeota archaeon]
MSKNWLFLTFLVGISVYWFANAVLWIPWILNELFGIIMMLILAPTIWGFTSYYCLKKYSNGSFWIGSLYVALIFLILAIILDWIFFGLYRNVPEQLYKPTTLSAYGLIFLIPFLITLIFNKRLESNPNTEIKKVDFLVIFICGIIFVAITFFSVQFW